MVRSLSSALCLCCWLGLGSVHARVFAQAAPAFDPAPSVALPLQAAPPVAPVLRVGPVTSPPLRADMPQAAPLRAPLGNPALDSDLARLRAAATTPGRGASARATQANAAWVLGLVYLHGIGVAPSPADAASWFERAQALGEPLAAAGLAWCEIEGCRTSPNPSAARRWIAPLRAVNLPRAQYLQWLVESRLSPLQIATPGPRLEPGIAAQPNRQLLLSAAQGGDVHATIELGFESLTANREAQALDYFRAAAARSPAAAANAELLAQRMRGPGPSARRPSASSGAQAGSPLAADTLARAQRNHRGEGQPANFVEAIRLYRLAQSQGSQQAKKMLELIFSRPGPDGQIDIAWMQQLAYVNLSQEAPSLDSATDRQGLRREPTPLFDLLPPAWRKYASR